MVAKILNDFFSNVITDPNSPPYIDPLINTENVEDPVSKGKTKFVNHPGIKTVRHQFLKNRFSFNKVAKSDIRKEIKNLNCAKTSQNSDILT